MKWQTLKPINMAVMVTITAMALTACGNDQNKGYKKTTTAPLDTQAFLKNAKAPTNVSLKKVSSASKESLSASWFPAVDDDTPAEQLKYELHAGEVENFTPSTKTKIYTGKNELSTTISNKLKAGQQYFIKLVVIDKNGAKAISSAKSVTIASQAPVVASKVELPSLTIDKATSLTRGQPFKVSLMGGTQDKFARAVWKYGGQTKTVDKVSLKKPVTITSNLNHLTINVSLFDDKNNLLGQVNKEVRLKEPYSTFVPDLILNPATPVVGQPFTATLTASSDIFTHAIWRYDGKMKTVAKADLMKPVTITTNKEQIIVRVSLHNDKNRPFSQINKTINLVNKTKYPSKLTATGLTLCSSDTKNMVECSLQALGSDWYGLGQDGETKAGETMSYTLLHRNGEECVKDNVTGLIWEQKTNDGGLRDGKHLYTWYNPDNTNNNGIAGHMGYGGYSCAETISQCNTYAYIEALNKANYCGYSDWRLPDINELISIVDYGRKKPAINPIFTNMHGSFQYLSSSPSVVIREKDHIKGTAWGVFFYDGVIGFGKMHVPRYVRAVRSDD